MSVRTGVWCELVCVVCAQTTSGLWVYSYSIPRGRMVSDAKQRGWTKRGREMVCRACSAGTEPRQEDV